MAETTTGAPNEPLRFDAPAGAAVCSKCATPIGAYYYEAGGAIYCAPCKRASEEAAGGGAASGGGGMGRAALHGIGAALVGALGYWLFIKVTGLDWALISIGVGIFVATAVRNASGGRSGRRYQVLAVALTYFAIGGAYAPLLVEGVMEAAAKKRGAAVSGDSTTAAVDRAPEGVATAASPGSGTGRQGDAGAAARPSSGDVRDAFDKASPGRAAFVVALVAIAVALAGPVLVVAFGGFPGALINVAIIGFALQRAWLMTGAAAVAASGLAFTGPYKLEPRVAAPAAGE